MVMERVLSSSQQPGTETTPVDSGTHSWDRQGEKRKLDTHLLGHTGREKELGTHSWDKQGERKMELDTHSWDRQGDERS